jgi:hypothetical protein
MYSTILVSLHRGVHLGAATEEGEVCKGDGGWKCLSEEHVAKGAAHVALSGNGTRRDQRDVRDSKLAIRREQRAGFEVGQLRPHELEPYLAKAVS